MSQTPPAKPVKDMAGYIAKNTKKATPSQPDWRGKVRVAGKEFLLSAWVKDGQPDLMNVSVTDPETLPPRPDNRQTASPNSMAPQQNQSVSSEKQGEEDIFNDLFGSV